MGKAITWEEMVNRAYARVMQAPDGSEEEREAAEQLERLHAYALDSMLVGRLQEAPCAD